MKNKHVGSDFEDFLRDEGLLEDAEATAAKRVIAFQLTYPEAGGSPGGPETISGPPKP